MKLKDEITLSIAETVSDVLEGKVKKEDEFKPHMMYDPETGKGHKAEKPEDHERMKKLGYTHEKPEVDEVAEPKAKGEKDFKDKHTVKKTYGPGAVKEEVTITLDEAKLKAGKGKAKIDVDHTGDGIPAASKKFKINFKQTRDGYDISGQKKDILAYLQSKDYDMDAEDIEDLFPELMEAKSKFSKSLLKKATDLALKMGGNMTGAVNKIEKMKKGLSDDPEVKAALQMANEEVTESVMDEAYTINEAKSKMAEDKERYQKFFKSALKKFGVTSPGELEGEKKKEFFNYVDKNYEADNETDKDESVKEDTIAEAFVRTFFSSDEMENVGGDKAAKKMGIKVKVDKGKGDNRYGEDRGVFQGDEKALVKYFQDYFGFEGKNFKELKKEFHK